MNNLIDMDMLKNIVIPLFVTILGGLIVLILWRKNNSKQERKKIYQPLLNKLAKTISELRDLIEQNYPPGISKNNMSILLEEFSTSTEYINLPKKIKDSLSDLQTLKAEYLKSFSLLLDKVAPLEFYVKHRPNNEEPMQYYIIDFILQEVPPSENIVLNFPMELGGFHSLFCDKDIAIRIHNEASEFTEGDLFKNNKFDFIEHVDKLLYLIKNEQIV